MSAQIFKGTYHFTQTHRSAVDENGREFACDRSEIQQDVVIAIDLDEIARRLGPKAFKSKGKKATFLKGAVILRQVDAREVTRITTTGR